MWRLSLAFAVMLVGSHNVSAQSSEAIASRVLGTWNQAWTGTKQVRIATFDGNRVSLSTPVSPDPVDGKMSVRSLIWEKLK